MKAKTKQLRIRLELSEPQKKVLQSWFNENNNHFWETIKTPEVLFGRFATSNNLPKMVRVLKDLKLLKEKKSSFFEIINYLEKSK